MPDADDRRVFLGWDRPALPAAADWLRDRYARDREWNLAAVTIVTPGARAGRRLLEVLVDRADKLMLVPPRIVTVGQLPELLYQPHAPIASDLQTSLAWLSALRTCGEHALAALVPHPPPADDLIGRMALVDDLQAVCETLAADNVTIAQAHAQVSADQQARWAAIATLHDQHLDALAQRGLTDRHAARRRALAERTCATDSDIVLLATADMGHTLRCMLALVAERVTALIHAPAGEAEGFDELGVMRVETWRQRAIRIGDQQLRAVDRPSDQATEALRIIDAAARTDATLTADDITVGLGDDALAPIVRRTLDAAGLPVRMPQVRLVTQTRPALLLAAMARYAQSHRFDDFAALLRHPDIDAWLDRALDAEARKGVADWLTLMDRYVTDHLQGRLVDTWLGDEQRTSHLKAVHEAIAGLIGDHDGQPRALPECASHLADMLARVYEHHALTRSEPDDHELIESLRAIGVVLSALRELDGDDPLVPRCNLPDAAALVAQQLAQAGVPDPGGASAIELLGYLELALDDAPHLIICGFNEGAIPQSRSADPLLPDGLRHALGLADNARRYARDALLLHVMLNSRPHVTLIAGRLTAEGDPLTPSRLLLACEAEQMPHRVDLFYPPDGAAHVARAPLFSPGAANQFLIPPPRPPSEPIDTLRVTAFRDYIACPYRFYLRHIAKLEPLDDRAVEMDALMFGNVLHEVLERFGKHEAARSDDADTVTTYLHDSLERSARQRFGAQPRATVVIQLEQMRQRLAAFARWQARQVREGWQVLAEQIEQRHKAVIDIGDGSKFTITGTIDRIDVHDVHGYRVLDYKSGDQAHTPEGAHRKGRGDAKQWVDLQLPLYRTLAQAADINGPMELGYINLPRDLAKAGLSPAKWSKDELDDALATAGDIVRAIRAGIFWPPATPPKYADAYTAVCMDTAPDRATLIARQDGGGA